MAMYYLAFSKLKAFKKAKIFSKRITELSDSFSDEDQYKLSFRMKINADTTLSFLKQVCAEGKKRHDFIENMDQLILNNSELELLLFEGQSYGLIEIEIYESLMEDCRELRVLLLEMINNVGLYFEKKRAPKEWFDW